MIWGYRFSDIESHLRLWGFVRFGVEDGIVLFRREFDVFTIREPNSLGWLPETIVNDAFENAGLPPPPQATEFVD